jgi:hypothetical protein
MTELAKQIFEDAKAMVTAQAELARTIEAAPRMVYLLWRGTTLLGIRGTAESAEREKTHYMDLVDVPLDPPIRIEPRVVHP